MKYLTPFLTSFFICVSLIFLIQYVFKKINWKASNRFSPRHIHRKGVSRLGGVVMVIAFVAAIFLDKNIFISTELYGFMFGALILLAVGFWDDFREVFWKVQLFFQIAVAIFIFIMGIRVYYVTNPIFGGIIRLDSEIGTLLSAILVIFWVIIIINSINWADGIDGLSGGISFITIATIFFLSFRPEVNQPPIAIICASLLGTVLGFLIFNFHPSVILAGTAGSMFLGFSIAILAIFSGTKIATALLVLALPLIDFLWVIGERIRNKKSIFFPDRNHLHHKLMELGWSQRKIVLCYWFITGIISVVALNTRALGKGFTMLSVVVLTFLAFRVLDKKIIAIRTKVSNKQIN